MNIIYKITSKLQSIFLNGLVLILPITLTTGLFIFSFKILTKWIEPLQKIKPFFLKNIQYSEIVLVILVIFIAGVFFKFFVLRKIFHKIESIIFNLPLVRPIYFGVKQLVRAFTIQDKLTFKQVVLVEFPRKGLYSVGFLTSKFPKEVSPNKNKIFYSIYIPSTPNPATGYFLVVPEEEIRPANISRQEAMALIISGGIIKPETKQNKK